MSATMAQRDPIILHDAARDRIRRAIEDGRLFPLRAYQADRLASTSRFNLDLWSRQTGKSHVAAMDAVHLAMSTRESVMCLSASKDLTRELMMKVAIYAEIVTGVAGEIQRALQNGELDDVMYVDDQASGGVRITQTTITLPGGYRVVGRPANPRTARGFSMHVKLDEFGMHQDQDEIFAAAFPSVTSRPHLRLDIMSTPGLRTDDKFADLCRASLKGETNFDLRKVTIHDAIRDGLNADAELLHRNIRDEDIWRREYLCEFVDESGAFLTLELIRGCEHPGLSMHLPSDPQHWYTDELGWDPSEGELFLGVDIGRRHDLTVFYLGQMLGDVIWTRCVHAMHRTPFAEQRAFGNQLMEHFPIRRMSVDGTGIGMQLAEEWGDRFGVYRVESLDYTNKLKARLAERLLPLFQDRQLRLPINATLRNDLHSLRKIVTENGNIRYAGERTVDGHADYFWALANMVYGAVSGVEAGVIFL